MGMSGDLEAAIAEGATIVRVGSAIFGGPGPGCRSATASLPWPSSRTGPPPAETVPSVPVVERFVGPLARNARGPCRAARRPRGLHSRARPRRSRRSFGKRRVDRRRVRMEELRPARVPQPERGCRTCRQKRRSAFDRVGALARLADQRVVAAEVLARRSPSKSRGWAPRLMAQPPLPAVLQQIEQWQCMNGTGLIASTRKRTAPHGRNPSGPMTVHPRPPLRPGRPRRDGT